MKKLITILLIFQFACLLGNNKLIIKNITPKENYVLSIRRIEHKLPTFLKETPPPWIIEDNQGWEGALVWGLMFGVIIFSITEFQDGINSDNGIRDMSGK